MKTFVFGVSMFFVACLQPRVAGAAAGACPAGLEGILKPFSNLVGVSVDFVEEKHIALLTKPLVNRGTVVFMAPGNLVRRIDVPKPSAVWLKSGELWIRDNTGERNLDVTKWGPANVLVNSFLYVLRGDVVSLKKHYRIDLGCEKDTWTMRLTPLSPDLAKILKYMVIVGRGADPETLEMLDGSGDRSLTRFGKSDQRKRFSPAQLSALFSSAATHP
jgi:hypothetical protein